jgi:hypothetical protein
MGKFLRAGSVLNVQKRGKRNVIAKDTLDDIGARMETNHRKTLHRLAVYSAESKSSNHSKKVLKLQSYKITAAQKLLPLNWKAGGQYCWWFVEPEAIIFFDPKIVFSSKGA